MSDESTPIIYDNTVVATTEILAKGLGTAENSIKVNFFRNRDRFVEGKHCYHLTHEEALNLEVTLGNLLDYSGRKGLILWTERGAARHAKILTTPEAWDMYEIMEDTYFRYLKSRITELDILGQMMRTFEEESKRITKLEHAVRFQSEKNDMVDTQLRRLEVNTRNGVPLGYLSRKQAYLIHGHGLSKQIFEQIMTTLEVPTQLYIHSENDHSSSTFAWLEDAISPAVDRFISNAKQVSRTLCASPMLNGKRFRFIKESTDDAHDDHSKQIA